jgi:DNA-binding transcriptional MerR regulator/methylmalonyl-CoA mutase cobalamin-binding subunit
MSKGGKLDKNLTNFYSLLVQMEQGYAIKIAARRTGLTPHVIRVWEKRYRAVLPTRTPTNRRLYSDADIERLTLLHRATRAGHSIGQIAQLPKERLLALVSADEAIASRTLPSVGPSPDESSVQFHLDACLAAIERLDAQALEAALMRAAVALSQPVLLDWVVTPVLQKIGDLWREGSLRVAHEHLASAVVRTFLGNNIRGSGEISASAPNLIAATPAGQVHELGALIVAVTAASEGWQVTYLGPNLPAEEIAGAAQQNETRVVALSLVYPADDPRLREELRKLRRYLAEEVILLVGGRAAGSYSDILGEIGAVRLNDMPSLRVKLESLRSGQPPRGRGSDGEARL